MNNTNVMCLDPGGRSWLQKPGGRDPLVKSNVHHNQCMKHKKHIKYILSKSYLRKTPQNHLASHVQIWLHYY